MKKSEIFLIQSILLLFIQISLVLGGSTSEWKQRTIYQLMTDRYALGNGDKPPCDVAKSNYCGGNFQGIINNLDYIKNMGFDAIWISPVVDNYPRGYHGYWARHIFEINSYFGSANDLKALTKACHDKGIWVMVDVVANHMGNTNQDYSQNDPFTNPNNYHDFCEVDKCNPSDSNCIERCRLASLADLKQEDEWVAQQLLTWINKLVNDYQFDGIRIDTVPYVSKDFWRRFAQSAGVFQLGEVFNGDMRYVAQYVGPLDSVFNYPAYFKMKDVFLRNTNMRGIKNMYDEFSRSISDISMLGLFSDNQDNPRFLSYCNKGKDNCLKLYKGWITFNLMSVGIPVIYYGTEQEFNGGNDPYDREAIWFSFNQNADVYKFIQTINNCRKNFKPYNSKQIEAYVDDQVYAFFRGKVFVGLSNVYDQKIVKKITYSPFANGEFICNIFYPKDDCLQIQNNSFNLYLNYGESKVFVPKASIEYSYFLDQFEANQQKEKQQQKFLIQE